MKVQANKSWQDSGVQPGSRRQDGPYMVIRASGQWYCRTDDRGRGLCDANGRKPNSGAQDYASISTENNGKYPFSGHGGRTGQLIGKLGPNGQPFVVGDHCKLTTSDIDPSLNLMLSMNENDGGFDDNEGALDVTFEFGDFKMPGDRH